MRRPAAQGRAAARAGEEEEAELPGGAGDGGGSSREEAEAELPERAGDGGGVEQGKKKKTAGVLGEGGGRRLEAE